MKVTFVVHRIYPPYFGGDEVQIMETAKELVKNGVDVKIFSADYTEGLHRTTFHEGVEINRFPSIRPYYVSSRLLNALCNVRTDILHSSTYGHFPTLVSAICKSKNRKIRYVLQPHYHGVGRNVLNSIVMKIYNPLIGRWIFEKADKVRCLSNAEMDLVINHFNIPPSKIVVIPFGLNVRKMGAFRNQCKKSHKGYRILYVGQLEKFKGVHLLIEAFARLLTFFPEDVTLRIVGAGSQKSALEKLAVTLKIQEQVSFLGSLPNEAVIREYCEADLFVLLSELESYSIATREALFFELPVIVLETKVFEDLLKGGYCFGVPSPVNLDVLAQKMQMCLTKDLRPRKFAVPTLSETVKSLIGLYTEMLET